MVAVLVAAKQIEIAVIRSYTETSPSLPAGLVLLEPTALYIHDHDFTVIDDEA
jgi:hypothetical protein